MCVNTIEKRWGVINLFLTQHTNVNANVAHIISKSVQPQTFSAIQLETCAKPNTASQLANHWNYINL